MEKMKITLASGNILEKPVLTAFKSNDKEYVILDNELNGSMGLPIILVSTLADNRLQKIADKSPEWEEAKGLLRNIIAGEKMDYVNVPAEIFADDVFFTQLTLPVASFDILKNNYIVVENSEEVQEQPEVVEENNEEQDLIENPESEVVNVVEENNTEVEPVTPDAPEMAQSEAIVENEEVKEETVNNNIDFTQEKEMFLKACENMFDAIVKKISQR